MIRWTLVLVGVIALAAALVVLWFAVRRSLRSLNSVTHQIGQIDPGDLSRRVQLEPSLEELVPVIATLNRLLDRLDTAMSREKEFTSDVAHELRTPLSGLRTAVEVAISRDRPGEEYRETLQECLPSLLQLQAMVESLLMLARLETGHATLDCTEVIVNDLLQEQWKAMEAEAGKKAVCVCWDLPARALITTDVSLLSVVLRNILDNAVTYVNRDGEINVAASMDSETGDLQIRITNTGSIVPSDQAKMVFERFWRGDTARTTKDGHYGLGLSVVRRAVTALGGTASATSQDRLFAITLSVPARS